MNTKKTIIVAVALIVAALHFLITPDYRGPAQVFIHGYLIDILVPMSMYLLTGLIKQPIPGARITRAVAVFGFGFAVESMQYFGIEVFGRTFDPMDYLMYAAGVVAGILFEYALLDRIVAKGVEK